MTLTLRRLDKNQPFDVASLQRLLEQGRIYHELVHTEPLSPSAASDELIDCPPGLALEHKWTLGAWCGDEMIGVVDLLRGYPDPDIAYLGLLQIGEPWQGAGQGRALYTEACNLARSWGCQRMRLAVVACNQPGLNFWQARGFIECYRKTLEGYRAEVIVMERSL